MSISPKFSGHDTFPLRHGWLYKSVNQLICKDYLDKSRDEQLHEAIVDLGVGRNMVNAIRYWAEMSGVLEASSNNVRGALSISWLGDFLFNMHSTAGGVDPYLENIASVWLLHYHLNANNDHLTSYRYFFNYSNFQSFEKKKLIDEVMSSCIMLTGTEPGSESTIRRDVDCFLHTYIKKTQSQKTVNEEYFSSPLSELGLISESSNGYFISELTDRKSLPPEIFAYALCDFIRKETADSGVNTIDFDGLLSKPGSPGRIFRLSEQGLSHKLDEASLLQEGYISWVDSLGLRQIQVADEVKEKPGIYLERLYGNGHAY